MVSPQNGSAGSRKRVQTKAEARRLQPRLTPRSTLSLSPTLTEAKVKYPIGWHALGQLVNGLMVANPHLRDFFAGFFAGLWYPTEQARDHNVRGS